MRAAVSAIRVARAILILLYRIPESVLRGLLTKPSAAPELGIQKSPSRGAESPRASHTAHDFASRLPEYLVDVKAADLPVRESGSRPKHLHFRGQMQSQDFVFFGITPGESWIDVYARNTPRSSYQRHGFSLVERRWAYQARVRNATEIRDMIDNLHRHLLANPDPS